MAGGQKLVAGQIVSDLGYKRAWDFGEKREDDERVSFYLLSAMEDHRGD
jgi:hypothetical protein